MQRGVALGIAAQKFLYLAYLSESCDMEHSDRPVFSSKYSSNILGNVILQKVLISDFSN